MDPNGKNQHIILRRAAPPANPGGGFNLAQPQGNNNVRGNTAIKLQIESLKPSAVAEFRKEHPDVVAVAPIIPMKLITPVGRPRARAITKAGQVAWGITAVGAAASQFTGKGVVVAVLDTGIDRSHPAFAEINIVEKDFTGEGSTDTNGHGTHCAGTIFGQTVNGTRIGVAPDIKKALIAKVLGGEGGSSAQIINAMQWALQEGANVISMSLGMDFPRLQQDLQAQGLNRLAATSQALEAYRANVLLFSSMAELIRQSHLMYQPCVVVAAAGNESKRPQYEIAVSPPAVSEGFISVAALGAAANGKNYTIAPFSNTGANVAGPGVNILSAAPGGGYATLSGTSMATPHVAGVAALWCESFLSKKNKDPKLLLSQILGSANYNDFSPGYDDSDVGLGMIQAP
jgi:subtilisin family serine protease